MNRYFIHHSNKHLYKNKVNENTWQTARWTDMSLTMLAATLCMQECLQSTLTNCSEYRTLLRQLYTHSSNHNTPVTTEELHWLPSNLLVSNIILITAAFKPTSLCLSNFLHFHQTKCNLQSSNHKL